jgi:hypothetical protein
VPGRRIRRHADLSPETPAPDRAAAAPPASPDIACETGWNQGCRHVIIRRHPCAQIGLPSEPSAAHRPSQAVAWLVGATREVATGRPSARPLGIRAFPRLGMPGRRRCSNKKPKFRSCAASYGNRADVRTLAQLGPRFKVPKTSGKLSRCRSAATALCILSQMIFVARPPFPRPRGDRTPPRPGEFRDGWDRCACTGRRHPPADARKRRARGAPAVRVGRDGAIARRCAHEFLRNGDLDRRDEQTIASRKGDINEGSATDWRSCAARQDGLTASVRSTQHRAR